MAGIRAAKVDDFSITVDGSLLILATVMSQMTFHQPCFGVMRIHIQNAINENLSDFPSFFGNRACCVRSIDTDLRILVAVIRLRLSSKNRKGFHLYEPRMSQLDHDVKRIGREIRLKIFHLICTLNRMMSYCRGS